MESIKKDIITEFFSCINNIHFLLQNYYFTLQTEGFKLISQFALHLQIFINKLGLLHGTLEQCLWRLFLL